MFSNTSSSWDLPDEDFDRSGSAGAPSTVAPITNSKPNDVPPVATSTPPQKATDNTTVSDVPTSARASAETGEFDHNPSKIFGVFDDKDESTSTSSVAKPTPPTTPTSPATNTSFNNTKTGKSDLNLSDWAGSKEPIDDEIFGVPAKEADLTDKINPDDFFANTKSESKEAPRPAEKPKMDQAPAPAKIQPADDSALRKQLDELRTKATETTGKMKELVEQLNDVLRQTTEAVTSTEKRNEELRRTNEDLEKKHKRLNDLINQARADLQ